MHFFFEKFAYVKNLLYLCIVIQKGITQHVKLNRDYSHL